MRVVAFVVVAACHADPAPAVMTNRGSSVAQSNDLAFVTVCTHADGTYDARWPAAQHRGQQFAIADDAGYVATVQIGTHAVDCDDCPGPSIDAAIVDPGRLAHKDECKRAFGPVTQPMKRARIEALRVEHLAGSHAVTPWIATHRVWFDGGGSFDVELVGRCSHVVASGCADHVCDETCTGFRRPQQTAVERTKCFRFVPDVADCRP